MVHSAVIFDLGQVVLRWVPERAFEQVMPAADVPAFMERVGFREWNQANDLRDDLGPGEAEWVQRFPSDARWMQAYRPNFHHTVTEMIPGTSAIIAELQQAGRQVSALTNWSGEQFALTRPRWGILDRFSDIVVSGWEGIAKPDPRIFELALERSGLDPAQTVFVDDVAVNVAGAVALGMTGVQFTSAEQLRRELVDLGLLAERTVVSEPIYHWAPRMVWQQALADGDYPWSARGMGYLAEGFVHFSFADQLQGTRRKFYADLGSADLVLLRLDPVPAEPLVVENGYPHLFAPLPLDRVVVEADPGRFLAGA